MASGSTRHLSGCFSTLTMTKIKTILVTGGAGFLGSHLCARLLAEGARVIAFDNLVTGNKKNIAPLLKHPRFSFVRGDVTKKIPTIKGLTHIVNLACPASPVHYGRDPIFTWKTNVLGIANILELARVKKIPLLHASTSEVYGDPLQHPQTEKYWGNVNPIGSRACYDEGKRAAETLCFDYRRQFGTAVKVARIFNTYGSHMAVDDGRVVSNFIWQALRGRPLTIYGRGQQTRSLCYVDDLIEGLWRFLQTADEIIGPINIGNSEEHTIRELAEKIIALTGSRSKIIMRPLPADDPQRRCPDISLAKKFLRWQPQVSWEDGLRKTIKYFQTLK